MRDQQIDETGPASDGQDYDPPFKPIDPHFPRMSTSGREKPATRSELEELIRSTTRTMWRTSRRYGGSPELEWTYPLHAKRSTAFTGSFPAYFYEPLATFEQARFAADVDGRLARGVFSRPQLEVGFRYFDSAYYTVDGQLRMPVPHDPFRGKHMTVALMGRDAEELRFVGWNPRWGDHGYGYITRDYFSAHVLSVVVTWFAEGGPSRAFHECLAGLAEGEPSRFEHLMRCWSTPNLFQEGRERINGTKHSILYWEVYSLRTERPVDVFEIRRSRRVVARAHVYHERDTTSIREIFVRPTRRRRGYASFLEEHALARAAVYGSRTMELWLHEDDAGGSSRIDAERFGAALGYVWREVSLTRPNVVAIGTKKV